MGINIRFEIWDGMMIIGCLEVGDDFLSVCVFLDWYEGYKLFLWIFFGGV